MPEARVYDADEVDRYVGELQRHVSKCQEEILTLRNELALSAVASRDEAAERALGRAMIQAQLAADRAADDAAQEAERILDDAHRQRRELLEQARVERDRIIDGARREADRFAAGQARSRSFDDPSYAPSTATAERPDLLAPPAPPWARPARPGRPADDHSSGRMKEPPSWNGGPATTYGVPFSAPPPTGPPVLGVDRDHLPPPPPAPHRSSFR